jgi:hypothetical protein
LELSFSTPELRAICEKRETAIAAFGAAAALELEQRLADIDAADTVADLATLFPDNVLEVSPSEQALRLKTGYRLRFCSGHVRTPLTSSGATDWENVARMRILAIERDDE